MRNTTDTAHTNNKTPTHQPMGFGEILDTTFSLYRKHVLLFLGIIGVRFCGSVVEYLLGRFLPNFFQKNLVVDLIGMSFILVSLGGIIVATATIYLGNHITSRKALQQVGHRFWYVLVCVLVWSLAFDISKIGIVPPMVSVIDPITQWTPGAPVETDPLIRLPFVIVFFQLVTVPFSIYFPTFWWAFAPNLLSFLTKLGTPWMQFIPLVLVPFSIYFAVRWTFATPTVLLEAPSIRRAFQRSNGLTRGGWWRIWGTLISFSFLSLAIHRIAQIMVGCILVLTRLTDVTNPVDVIWWVLISTSIDAGSLFLIIMAWISTAISALIFPIWIIGITLLYFDLQIRKFGTTYGDHYP